MKHYQLLKIAVLSWFIFLSSGHAAEIAKNISFERGKSSATIAGSVIRRDRDVYTLTAKAGQVVSVHVSALENNVAFQVFEAGKRDAVVGAQDGDDATHWRVHLQKSGAIRIVVGGIRGNAIYRLDVSIK